MSDFPPCTMCERGVLVPLSDYGPDGSEQRFKVWACTNSRCQEWIGVTKGVPDWHFGRAVRTKRGGIMSAPGVEIDRAVAAAAKPVKYAWLLTEVAAVNARYGRCSGCNRGYIWSKFHAVVGAESRRCPWCHIALRRSLATARCKEWWLYSAAHSVMLNERAKVLVESAFATPGGD